MHQPALNDERQQHRAFQKRVPRVTIPHQSIDARQYWKTLERKLEVILPTDASFEEA